jgi:NADH:ubiquinone oxidoreductase subunit D
VKAARTLLVAALLAAFGWTAAAAETAPPGPPLVPVHLQQVTVRGFWRDQVKRLAEQWIPHCIAQMEEGGRGRELLNLVHAARVLKGEPAGKFTGTPWSDAYVYNTIEGTIAHFKLVMEGLKPPPGEVYVFTEGGNGELGFYIVSDGSGTPYRVRVRPPCWFNLQACRSMVVGDMIADIIPTFGSINMIGGECDR